EGVYLKPRDRRQRRAGCGRRRGTRDGYNSANKVVSLIEFSHENDIGVSFTSRENDNFATLGQIDEVGT
ncbi:MAG: hypothetical protein WA820_28705, partial [Bradyrhizobium sp.]